MSARQVSLCIAAIAITSGVSLAYEPATHEVLSQEAAIRSVIYTDPAFLPDLGLSSASTFTERDLFGQVVSTARDAKAIVGRGAVHEDYYEVTCSSNPTQLGWMRIFNHFFDPQHGGRGLTVGPRLGLPSPDWALEDRGEVTTIGSLCAQSGRAQTYSYRQAQEHLYSALTGQAPDFRQQEISIALQTLGNIVHHVQDMAQPQHSRNDIHFIPETQGYYEVYTNEHVRSSIPQILQANPYPVPGSAGVPQFATARQYWVTNGMPVPAYTGMAEFTSSNYVTYGTNFQTLAGSIDQLVPDARFPYPNATNANGTQKRIESRNITLRYADNSQEAGPSTYVVGDVYDGFTNQHHANQILAETSLLFRPLKDLALAREFHMSEAVFEDNYRILLPRAVAFSAGLINHFFAGRLDLVRAPSGTGWTIRNLSGETMTGTFGLHYEDGATIRFAVAAGGGLQSTWTGTLTHGQSTPVLAEPPASARKLVGVFRGTLGAETSLTRVAGKVIAFSPPPVACAGTLKREGGFEGLDVTHELGSTSGTVQLKFEAFSIQDSLVVNAAGGTNGQLTSTGGMVSGFHSRTFAFNPSTLGTTKARVRIVGSLDGTWWTLAMSCPGQNLGSGDFPPTRSVRFDFGSALTGAAGSCQASVFIDGASRGTAFVSAAGGNSITVQMTKGPGHGIEFRNFSCTAGNANLLLGAQYTDPGGTVRLQNFNVPGVRLFDVR